jgi:DNA-binding CsgD family transcriptional regulator
MELPVDHLLVVPLKEDLCEPFLGLFRQAGWRVTIEPDVFQAKSCLQTGGVTGIALELDPSQPDPERFRLLRHVHEFHPTTLAIILNAATEPFRASAEGLVRALESVSQHSKGAHAMALAFANLTPAQQRIAELVAQAHPNREIAHKLKIKEQSVRNELTRIFKKTGTWNRVGLALFVREGEKEASLALIENHPAEAAPATEFTPSMDPPDPNMPPVLRELPMWPFAG